MKTFALGDCHGGYRSLMQCLERSKFNYDKDKLIVLGDIVDGWPDTPLVIEELLKIKNLRLIWGNHDVFADQWLKFGARPDIWTMQGGKQTIDSYIANPELMIKHRNFFDRAMKYYVEKDILYAHGGFNPEMKIEDQHLDFLTWDRGLYDNRHDDFSIEPYKEVYVGHTTTWAQSLIPFCKNSVWFLDQGGGWEGKLTIMNVNTHKFWQSDVVKGLYPECRGR